MSATGQAAVVAPTRRRRRGADGGSQATIRFVDGGSGDVGGVVIKTYRPRATDFGFQNEIAGLYCLGEIVHRVPACDGWRVAAAEVVQVDAEQRQITIRRVAGKPLSAVRLQRSEIRSIATLLRAVLQEYWAASGTVLGDLQPDNILIDTPTRQLVLIDPGAPNPSWLCPQVTRNYAPASRDIGSLLTDGVSRLPHRTRHTGRNRRMAWAIATIMLEDSPPEAKVEAVACAQALLDRLLTDYPDTLRIQLAHRRATWLLRQGARRKWRVRHA